MNYANNPLNQENTILNCLKANQESLSAQQILAQLPKALPLRTLQYQLKKLVQQQRIVQQGKGRATKYALATQIYDTTMPDKPSSVNLFEVTLKKVDCKRLDDCLQSLSSVSMLEHQVSFICRLPADVAELSEYKDGTLKYKGKTFNFVDIDGFIRSTTVLLSSSQIKKLQLSLVAFMAEINRPVATKSGWAEIFG